MAPKPEVVDHSKHFGLMLQGGGASTTPIPQLTAALLPPPAVGFSDLRVQNVGPTVPTPRPEEKVGAFRIQCDTSHFSYDDPLVHPSNPGAAHLHTFFGNTLANAYSTAASLASSGNSTCKGGIANRSAYWIPALMYLDPNQTTLYPQGVPLVPEENFVYYKTAYRFQPSSALRIPPNGLGMIAGRSSGSPDSPQNLSIASWSCPENKEIAPTPHIPNCGRGKEIELSIAFPQCWDKVNLYKPDQSHVVYARGDKTCPDTHPYAFPEIRFNISWRQPDVANLNIKLLRLSSDAYSLDEFGGYSAHADWFDGWDPNIKRTFTRECVKANKDCHGNLLGDGRVMYGSTSN